MRNEESLRPLKEEDAAAAAFTFLRLFPTSFNWITSE